MSAIDTARSVELFPEVNVGWINDPRRRAAELAVIGAAVPLEAFVGGAACLAVLASEGTSSLTTDVNRSLYPGNVFKATKLGNPESDTAVARFIRKSMLDEFPQLLDVVKGDMSLNGPRSDEPEHIDLLFEAVDDDLRAEWMYVRSIQKPGIISSYAIHSHGHNLEAKTERTRYPSGEKLRTNANLRANLDIWDARHVSLQHDAALVTQTIKMVFSNYRRYAHRSRLKRWQPDAAKSA